MFNDLIEYVDLLEASAECFGFGYVTFKRDFDKYKAGDKVESLWFDLEKSTMTAQTNDGTTEYGVKFKIVPVIDIPPVA